MYLVSKLSQYHSVRKSEAFVLTIETIHRFFITYIVCMLDIFFTDLVVNINLSKIVAHQAEGLTAIEVWMLTCILFVFGKLVIIIQRWASKFFSCSANHKSGIYWAHFAIGDDRKCNTKNISSWKCSRWLKLQLNK